MKAILYAGTLLLFAVLICGCTTAPPTAGVAANNTTPNLVGNWTGPSVGYLSGTGFTDYADGTFTMKVTEQKGRIFNGEFVYANRTGMVTSHLGGVIGRDGTALTIAEQNGGYSHGTVVSANEIELIFTEDGEPIEAAIDSLKRV